MNKMRSLMVLALVAALLALTVIPAYAQVLSDEPESELDIRTVDQPYRVYASPSRLLMALESTYRHEAIRAKGGSDLSPEELRIMQAARRALSYVTEPARPRTLSTSPSRMLMELEATYRHGPATTGPFGLSSDELRIMQRNR
jgi:hypothetical protein